MLVKAATSLVAIVNSALPMGELKASSLQPKTGHTTDDRTEKSD